MIHQIESKHNKTFKRLISLKEKETFRKQQQEFLVEGTKEVLMAWNSGIAIRELYINQKASTEKGEWSFLMDKPKIKTFTLSQDLFEKISYRSSTAEIVAVCSEKKLMLDADLKLPKKARILLLENIEKPGNIGAILRTADASKQDLVCLVDCKTSVYNANVIRSSVGTVFNVPIVVASIEQIALFLEKNRVALYGASLSDSSIEYTDIQYEDKVAIAVGSEKNGLSSQLTSLCKEKIIIPQFGVNDSLNVSVATAILAYEILRQKKKNDGSRTNL